MSVWYNEIEGYAADWLERLAARGAIPGGTVERRSVREVDRVDAGTAHFFAGIGGWAEALRLAGWPAARDVWTGSCPCQPFSGAGGKRGFADERHLWPEWFRLIAQHRPPVVFGEQVASPDGLRWLDLVSADLEGAGYAFGAADLCAAGVGAPHGRQRLYFVAYADEGGARQHAGAVRGDEAQHEEWSENSGDALEHRGTGMGDAADARRQGRARTDRQDQERGLGTGAGGARLADDDDGCTVEPAAGLHGAGQPGDDVDGRSASGWRSVEWVACRDPGGTVYRPIEPGLVPVVDGFPGRVGQVRAYGNAIVPQVAAVFIRAFLESEREREHEPQEEP